MPSTSWRLARRHPDGERDGHEPLTTAGRRDDHNRIPVDNPRVSHGHEILTGTLAAPQSQEAAIRAMAGGPERPGPAAAGIAPHNTALATLMPGLT